MVTPSGCFERPPE